MDETLARKISDLLLEAAGSLNETAQVIAQSGCEQQEKRELTLAIGGAMGKIGTELLNPLYRRFPAIKPADYLLPEDFTRPKDG